MIVDLQRAFSPEECGQEEECAVCRLPFRTEVILAQAVTDYRMEMGHACPACVEYLGVRSPEHFPTIEEYRELVERYPEPIWSSCDEAGEAWNEDDYDKQYKTSWVWRAPA